MLVAIHPVNPQKRILDETAAGLKKGNIYILPTDTAYALVAAMDQKKAIERIYFLKKMQKTKPISLFCKDISVASTFIRMDHNQIFRWMKAHLPGPYTLIFKASKNLPNFALTDQKTVGIRIVSNPVISGILERMETPIVGSSIFMPEEYLTYPEELDQSYGKQISAILDTGPVENLFSTVLDMTVYPPEIVREGKGPVEDLPG